MTDETLNLDEFRNPDARQRTLVRRQQLEMMQSVPFNDTDWHEVLERYLSATDMATLPDTVTMAIHLLRMFSMTEEAEMVTRRQLIAKVIEDLSRLTDIESAQS